MAVAARMAPAALASQLGMRLGSELRPGATPALQGPPPQRTVHPVTSDLAPLLPAGGLAGPVGIRNSGQGATSLLLRLLAAATTAGRWCALVGLPRIYPIAAPAAGVNLERLALVEVCGPEERLAALSILCEGVPVVVTASDGFTPTQLQRAHARAERSGTTLIWLEGRPVPRLDARFTVAGCEWVGLRANSGRRWGAGRLTGCCLEVAATWRSGRTVTAHVWPFGPETDDGGRQSGAAARLTSGRA